jgi:GTPase involved in cell partitioning and DNA repair
MIETINELEKSKRKGAGVKSGKDKKGPSQYFPKKIVIGNKKDLRKNLAAGTLDKSDIQALDGIKIKEVSALTNQGISEAFKALIEDLQNDPVLSKENEEYNKKQAEELKKQKDKNDAE